MYHACHFTRFEMRRSTGSINSAELALKYFAVRMIRSVSKYSLQLNCWPLSRPVLYKMDTFSLDLQLVFFRNNGILNQNRAEKNICKKPDCLSPGWWPNGANNAHEKHYILSKNVQNYNEQSNEMFLHKLCINKIIFQFNPFY